MVDRRERIIGLVLLSLFAIIYMCLAIIEINYGIDLKSKSVLMKFISATVVENNMSFPMNYSTKIEYH
jgi:hypothetical protein